MTSRNKPDLTDLLHLDEIDKFVEIFCQVATGQYSQLTHSKTVALCTFAVYLMNYVNYYLLKIF